MKTTSSSNLLPLFVLYYAACLAEAQAQQQHQQAQQLLPPLPKVDPLSDGIYLRSVELPIILTNNNNGEGGVESGGGGGTSEGDGAGGGSSSSKSRQRLIMYDFRPALPPYTKESLGGQLLLFPKDPIVEELQLGEERMVEEEGVGQHAVVEHADDGGNETVVTAKDESLEEVLVVEEEEEIVEDAHVEEDGGSFMKEEAPLETQQLEQVDATNEQQPEDDQPTTTSEDNDSEMEATDVLLSEIDLTLLEIPPVNDDDPKLDASIEQEKEVNEAELSKIVDTSTEEDVASGQEKVVKEVESTDDDDVVLVDDGDMNTDLDAPSSSSLTTEEDVTAESSAEQEHQEEAMKDTQPAVDSSPSSQQVESQQPPKEEVPSLDSDDDHIFISDESNEAGTENIVSLEDVGGEADSSPIEKDKEEIIPSETSAATDFVESNQEEILSETPAATEFDLERTNNDNAESDEAGAKPASTEEDVMAETPTKISQTNDIMPEYSDNAQEESTTESQTKTIITGGTIIQPQEKITVHYDDDTLTTPQSSSSSSSSATTNNKDANRQFVTGLDEIDKLFESVEVPDELDVGADGSSMQDVLVGQGLKIIWKRAENFGRGVKDKFEHVVGGVKSALLPLGILGEEEEEEMTFDSLFDLKKLNEDGGSLLDRKKEKKSEEVVAQPKQDDGQQSNKPKKKEKKQQKEKEKKKKNEFPLVKSQKAQKIWKFARRKWEQARHILDDLFQIFDGAEDDDDDDGMGLSLGDMKLGKKGSGMKGVEMPNFDGKFGSEVDESFLKSRYEAMMNEKKLQQDK